MTGETLKRQVGYLLQESGSLSMAAVLKDACILTVEDIYGKPFDQLVPPKGYAFTGEFRTIPEEGTTLLMVGGAASGKFAAPYNPRLVLRKLKPRKVVTFTETADSPRIVCRGEWTQLGDNPDNIIRWTFGPATLDPHRVYARAEEMIEE